MARQTLATRAERTTVPRRLVRILLVEDCASDVFLVERMLKDATLDYDYDITDVPRLVDAFYAVERNAFDVIMLDLNLLDIDGVAAVAALHAEAPATPIIVYSGMDNVRLKEEALMCGATHYLVKGRESGYGLKYMIESALSHRKA